MTVADERADRGMDGFDLIIRGGTVVDGTGGERFLADVGVRDGLITAVTPADEGGISGSAEREIDATGLIVTPGWVDIHTHYDGQLTWDPLLTPSCWHGVTTAVMGNCGIGFAPVRRGTEGWLVEMMESTEDIPARCLHESIQWNWESFPEYLDAVDAGQYAMDVGTQVPHAALRAYVMGERGADNEEATEQDAAEMARLVAEGIEAGALGFSFSRTKAHTYRDGWQPGTLSGQPELEPIARAIAAIGGATIMFSPRGVTGLYPDERQGELDLAEGLADASGGPVMMCLIQHGPDPEEWEWMLSQMTDVRARGVEVLAQCTGRSVCTMAGFATKFNPFAHGPSWEPLASLSLADVAKRILADPDLRTRLLSEADDTRSVWQARKLAEDRTYPLVPPGQTAPQYEPSESVAAIGARTGRSGLEVMLDVMCEDEGQGLLNYPHYNFIHGNLDAVRAMMVDPGVRVGLSDAGAHLETIADASLHTFMVTHWGRDRENGIPLEQVVRKITSEGASVFGLDDRGVVAPGKRADLNVIDYDHLELGRPWLAHDVPADGARLLQRATGYRYTLVAGEVTFQDGEHTGALPGRLVRRKG
jgi:N-acyl-D-amino-acid deacylase